MVDFEEAPLDGTGIVFEPNDEAFLEALEMSFRLYNNKKAYAAVQRRGMERDFSWSGVTRKYEELYLQSI